MQLYTGKITPNGKRVKICAAELDLPLEPLLLDFQRGEQRMPDYLARNPMGKVPTFVEQDFVLWESGAILYYLAQKKPNPLWPSDARAQADVLRWMFFTSCHIDPYVTTLVVERLIKARSGSAPDVALTADAERWLARFVPIANAQLATREYLTGQFGLADIALGCSLELHSRLSFDLTPYPDVRAWLGRLQARDSWRRNSA